GLFEIARRRRPAPAFLRRQLKVAGTFLFRSVEIVGARNAGLLRRFDKSFAKRMRLADIGNRQWTPGTMKLVSAALLILGALEVGEDILERPAGIAELAPVIVVLVLAADIEKPIDRTGTAQ